MRYTLDEVAKELRKTRRWLNEWLRAHPLDQFGEPFYTPIGRDKIFRLEDIDRIDLALRGELKCRCTSGRRVKAKRRTLKSAGHTEESAWKQAAELLGDPTLANGFERSKSASSGTGNTRRRTNLKDRVGPRR